MLDDVISDSVCVHVCVCMYLSRNFLDQFFCCCLTKMVFMINTLDIWRIMKSVMDMGDEHKVSGLFFMYV